MAGWPGPHGYLPGCCALRGVRGAGGEARLCGRGGQWSVVVSGGQWWSVVVSVVRGGQWWSVWSEVVSGGQRWSVVVSGGQLSVISGSQGGQLIGRSSDRLSSLL